jgi:N-acetylmuramoyl-L-alanine amidase
MYINTKFSSVNSSVRTSKIEYIILHYTEIPLQDALTRLISAKSEVSAHYLIKKDGEVLQLVDDYKIAWHAGKSSWKNFTHLNRHSLGIEIDNSGISEFSSIQIESCIELCLYLLNKHNINPARVIGHSDVAPDRKIDPGIFFDWQRLAKHGLGWWHNLDYSQELANKILYKFGQEGKKIAKLQQDLRKLGYKVNISGKIDIQTNNVIRAFQAHFCPKLIWNKGGINFYRNLENLYEWDSFSEEVLQNLLS